MKVLLSWLQEFAPITGSPDDLAETMTDLGMVCEEVSIVGADWDGVVVAEVLGLSPHPGADRIQLVSVDAGDGEPLQVCCGAFNMAVGDRVPLATIGTIMPNGMEIARRKLRGEWSNGMLCAAGELGATGDDDGIWILDPAFPVGRPLAEVLDRHPDVLFDLDIEGNRPDALSVAGVARDLAARLGVPFTIRTPEPDPSGTAAADRVRVEVRDRALCPRFGVRVLDGITIGPSPRWMADRLTACGVRSINAIVDISNYVMLELGQPNHTYDLDLVADGELGVRRARSGETLTTLDDVKRRLDTADGVIVNAADEPIGLAGVMGGASTEITDVTTSVVVEAAVWDRMSVARTSRRLGLRSEASTRFERGVDPAGIERALDRFCQLAAEICGATVAPGTIVDDDGPVTTPTIILRGGRLNRLLNVELDPAAIGGYLTAIGFGVGPGAAGVDDELSVTVPPWRPDVTQEIDLVEEVARHHGYDRSGRRVPRSPQAGGLSPHQRARRAIRAGVLGAGATEVMPTPFLAPGDLHRAGLGADGISLTNPLVAEESVLRTSLLPGLLKAVAANQAHRSGPLMLSELGRVFHPSGGELPVEPEQVAVISSGHGTEGAATAAVQLLHRLAAELHLTGLSLANRPCAGLHPGRSAVVRFRGAEIGEVGEVDPDVTQDHRITGRLGWLRLDVAPIVAALASVPRLEPVSRFPSSDIDLAFVVADRIPAAAVSATLAKAGRPLVRRVALFDVYRGDAVPEDARSLAFGLRLQADDRTLTDAEVAEVRQTLIYAVTGTHDATLR
ncbi:MAG: phenylalanine--tRNA ligase subunit beta [Acidimicrobiales bacterium]